MSRFLPGVYYKIIITTWIMIVRLFSCSKTPKKIIEIGGGQGGGYLAV
jgi:hypothetical protein